MIFKEKKNTGHAISPPAIADIKEGGMVLVGCGAYG
jgi:hypothetical protein